MLPPRLSRNVIDVKSKSECMIQMHQLGGFQPRNNLGNFWLIDTEYYLFQIFSGDKARKRVPQDEKRVVYVEFYFLAFPRVAINRIASDKKGKEWR